MAGAFSHMLLVNTICRNKDELDRIDTLTPEMKYAVMKFTNFCELGAVSPDCPFLMIGDANAQAWGNVMHYWKPSDFIRTGIGHLDDAGFGSVLGKQLIAWLFGYAAHVVADLTIHPIVKLHVGPYEKNKAEHRRCETNQDVYIFNKLLGEQVTKAGYISNCGVGSCVADEHSNELTPAVRELWYQCVNSYPAGTIKMKDNLPCPEGAPGPNEWFKHYSVVLEEFGAEGGRFLLVFRDFAEAKGLVYPEVSHVDESFIENLQTPDGRRLSYDAVFEQARQNIITAWRELGAALQSGDPAEFTLANGDLDTGLDDHNNRIYWRN